MPETDDQKEINKEGEGAEKTEEPKITRAQAMKRIGLLALGTLVAGSPLGCYSSSSGTYYSYYYSTCSYYYTYYLSGYYLSTRTYYSCR